MRFYHQNFKVVLYDNTVGDSGKYAKWMNDLFKSKYGPNNTQFEAFNTSLSKVPSVIERMCITSNLCRDYFLKNNYQLALSLETDVFPTQECLGELIMADKDVIGALYDRDEGKSRKLMIQERFFVSPNKIQAVNIEPGEDVYFVNGEIKEVSHVGLGCVLMNRLVLEKIKFRFIKGQDMHPDTYFAEDCFRNGFKINAHTALVCEHKNKAWGTFGIDFH